MFLCTKGFEENVVSCELQTHLTVKMTVFWNVTPCGPVEIYESVDETCCL
jgi:hypothetical protein